MVRLSPDALLAILWTVWFAVWWLAALFTARTVARQSIAGRLAHTLLICAGAALIVRRTAPSGLLARPFVPRLVWIGWFGVLVAVVGLAHTVRARVHLGRLWSGAVTLKADHAIVRSGPYALTRHPIYTGLLLALCGTALARGTLGDLAGLALVVAGVMLKIRQEEALLTEHFGDAYRAYQAEVPSVIPRLARRL